MKSICVFCIMIQIFGCGVEEKKAVPPSGAEPETQIKASPAPQPTIIIHVTGGITVPGVYEIPQASRVIDAVEAAGGLTENADERRINLAQKIADGQKIHVPKKGEAEPAPLLTGSSPFSGGGKVNLTTATLAQLDTLPGVGPALGQRV